MTSHIVAFTLDNVKAHHLLPIEDSYKFHNSKSKKIVVVADGITRDPIGLPYLPSSHEFVKEIEFVEKYPRPSPAKIAADNLCKSFIHYLKTKNKMLDDTILESFSTANKEIQKLNKKKNSKVDYLENDFWGCVASGGVIKDKTLYWGYICDCGICVYDKDGKLKFRTTNDKRGADKNAGLHGKDWKDPKWRAKRRKEYRNNPNKIIDGKLASYGAFTGENKAVNFIKTETHKLNVGDYVFFYTDGMEEIVFSKKFQSDLRKKGFSELKEFCKEIHHQKEGAEATLVGVLIK